MVCALDSGSSSPGSVSVQGHCVVFLAKTLNFHSASLYSGVQMGTGTGNGWGNPVLHHIQGGVEILPVASCYRNWNEIQPAEPLGTYMYADFTLATFFIGTPGFLAQSKPFQNYRYI